ncbi:MAG TPA: preprotein translocase subunit YajC [Rickettsiales bacterium]|nr:preprotein translocase subunit YajC [Rickettsiales bacterium]
MFVSTALAADPADTAASGGIPQLMSGALPMILIMVVFYFLLIRPNQQKIKEHDTMVKALRRGDKIVTSGGIIGTISKVEDDNIVVLEIAENVKVRVMRDTISHVLTKTIANDNKAEDKNSGSKLTEKSGGK